MTIPVVGKLKVTECALAVAMLGVISAVISDATAVWVRVERLLVI